MKFAAVATVAVLFSSGVAQAGDFVMKANEARIMQWPSSHALVHFKGATPVTGGPSACHFSVQAVRGNGNQYFPLEVKIYKDPFVLKDWMKIACNGDEAVVTQY